MNGIRPAAAPTEVRPEWVEIRDELPPEGRLIAIGPTDVGKSTIAWWFARELAARRSEGADAAGSQVAIVDADIGQSRIGPPACVGWQEVNSNDVQFYFVGAISPARRPSSALKATVAACRSAAENGMVWTVIDTTGYLAGKTAIALKQAKIKHLRPVHVLAISDDPDLEPVIEPWHNDPQVTVHRIPTPPAVSEKSKRVRVNWRQRTFARWLSGSNLRWISSQGREFVNSPPRELFGRTREAAAELKGLLLGFSDSEHVGICLGLLNSYDFRRQRVLALCPEKAQAASIVDFGCLRLEPDGTQITTAGGNTAQ